MGRASSSKNKTNSPTVHGSNQPAAPSRAARNVPICKRAFAISLMLELCWLGGTLFNPGGPYIDTRLDEPKTDSLAFPVT